jgi:hypothetical protein
MISSIIRTYKLYRKDIEFEEIHQDTHSFLMTKIDKFKPSKEKKAYSYFGTICKNYLMGQILKDQKETNRKISYEDISSDLENRPEMIYYLEIEPIQEYNVIPILKDYIKTTIEEDITKPVPSDVKALSNVQKTATAVSNKAKAINSIQEFPGAFENWFQTLGFQPGKISKSILRAEVEKVLVKLGYK